MAPEQHNLSLHPCMHVNRVASQREAARFIVSRLAINGISNLGVIVDFRTPGKKRADLNVYQRINGLDTLLNGVNGRDDVVGIGAVLNRGFVSFHVESSESGETSEALKPVRIHFPNSSDTIPWSINYAQAIVGSFTGSDNVSHGFLAVH